MSYSRSAEYYDLLYAWKNYAAETERIHQLVQDRRPGAKTLLDVACGTGQHLAHLRTRYEVQGLDAEPAFLAIARRRLPGVPLHEGDMREFELRHRFDAVTCLFSAIGYMHTPHDLARAVARMAGHLTQGGVLFVEPWLSVDRFDPNHIGGPLVGEAADLKVVRLNSARVEGRLSVMEFHHLVGRPGNVEHFVETHALALYSDDEYRTALAAAGLRAELDEEGLMGRGLWIGVKAED